MTLNPGDLIHDRYRIEGIIGKGGMGAVYRGEDTVLLVTVAIKENLNPLPQAVRQFKREALLLASLRHPNLPRVTDHFVVDELQYLIMDYVPGDDLKTILEHEGSQPELRVMNWTREIIKALSYLHNQHPQVVHRDIKPANIKITPEGKPVLVDFGIAKASEAGGVTTTGARSLTPGFAPPEQYGSSPTDARSDQYSLAATMYNLLTGSIPPDSLERTLGQAILKPARELNPKISPAIDRSLWKAMSLSPSERFATVDDFLEALEGKLAVVETVPASREPLTQVRRVPEKPTRTNIPAPYVPEPENQRAIPWPILIGIGGFFVVLAAVVGLVVLTQGGSPSALSKTTSTQSGMAAFIPSATFPRGTAASPLPGPTETEIPPTIAPPTITASPTLRPTPIGGSRLLAFVSNRSEDKHYQIYTYDSVTKESRQLTFDPTHKGRLAWSSDGQKIFFEGRGNGGKWDIFRMNVDGTDIKNLTNNPADDMHPAVSLRGNVIAFASTRIEGFTHVYTVSFEGLELVDISAKHNQKPFNMPDEWDPAWSPDSRYLYFVLSVVGPTRIYRWNTQIPDSDPVLATIFDGDYTEAEPAVSPQGNLFAYTRIFSGGSEICVSETDLAKRRPCEKAITDRTWNSNPNWSPDSLWIAFASRRSGNSEIYVMTVSGASITNLTNHAAEDRYPAWQPAIKNP